MILIFGGAYQGKLEYALQQFHKKEEDIFYCTADSIAFSKPILYGLEHFVFGCAKSGMEAKDILIDNRQKLSDRIIIASDVSQGIVPMDPTERAFREMMGRTMLYLAAEADQVYRVFCGLGQQIK